MDTNSSITAADTTPLMDLPLQLSRRSGIEKIVSWIPVIGWIITTEINIRRRRPKERFVYEQLQARSEAARLAWGPDSRRRAVAAVVADAIQREYDWPNTYYLPDDRLDLLLWGYGGSLGGDAGFCMMDIQMHLRARLGVQWKAWHAMTIGQFVDECLIQTAK